MRMRRRLALIVAGIAGTLVALAVLAFGLIQTGPGKRHLAGLIEDLASSPEQQIRIVGLDGFVPADIAVARIEIADRQGVWAVAENVAIHWSPLALLNGHLDIARLHARNVEIARQPAEAQQSASNDTGAGRLPRRIDIGSLSVETLTLGPALSGETTKWRLSGKARMAGLQQDNWLTIKAERSDGGDGMLDLDGRYDGGRETIDLKLIAREGAATLNRFSRLDASNGIDMRIDVAGPLTDLRGTLKIDAGDLVQATGTLRAERQDNTTRATLALNGVTGRLGEAAWAPALAGNWSLQAQGTIDAATIVVEQAELMTPAGNGSATGRIDRRRDSGDLTFAVDAAAQAFVELLPGVDWSRMSGTGRLSGKLAQPSFAVDLAAEGLTIKDVTIGRATARIDGATREDRSISGTLSAALNEIGLPTGDGRIMITDATMSLNLTRSLDGIVDIREIRIASPVLQAEGAGRYDTARDLLSGTARLAARDLADFAAALNRDIAGKLDLTIAASQAGNVLSLSADATLENGKIPDLPTALLAPKLTTTLRGTVASDRAWRVEALRIASDAGSIDFEGQGTAATGRGRLDWRLADLTLIDPRLAGRSQGTATVEGSLDALVATGKATFSDARFGVAEVPQLALSIEANRAGSETSGKVAIEGEMQKAPIRGGGDFMISDDGRARIGKFELRWASLTATATGFMVAATGSKGDVAVKIEKLQDLNPFLPDELAGSLNASIKAVEPNSVKVTGTLREFRFNEDVSLDRAQIEATISDPLGKIGFSATVNATGESLVGPLRQITLNASGDRSAFALKAEGSGEKLRGAAQGKVTTNDAGAAIDLQTFTAVYSGQNVTLVAPARIAVVGSTTTIERIALRTGNGTLTASGTLAPQGSKLDIQGRALPLLLLQAIDPEIKIIGTANFAASLRGAQARPDIDITLDANEMRVRTIRTAGIPPGALTAKATLRGTAASIEGRFSAGQANVLNFSGSGSLPGPDGLRDGRLKTDGNLQLALLTPFLAGNGRISGAMAIDLTFNAAGGGIAGNGTLRIVDGHYFNFDQGIAIRDIDATVGVSGDRLEIRQFTARSGGDGRITASGGLQLDRALELPVDVTMVAKSARIINRRDFQATVSSTLRLNGSVATGLTLSGAATIERAELNLDETVNDGPAIANLEVREINRPGGAADDKPNAPVGPVPETKLAIKLDAPRSVFVRGRGLDVEMGGTLDIGGTLGRPQILGMLQLRRGTFSGIGRRLEFTRGTVSFPDPDRLEPVIDFTAATKLDSGTAEIAITGRPSAPKVSVSSSPALPQDEIMAQLLFGRSTSTLSPLQMAEIGQSIGSLSGLTGSGGGILDRLRKALGFDRLGVSSNPDSAAAGSSPLGGSSLEIGRNVAPGVYLGAKQGAASGSSTAVVEIELSPNIKVESEIGADARGKVGVSLEWDY